VNVCFACFEVAGTAAGGRVRVWSGAVCGVMLVDWVGCSGTSNSSQLPQLRAGSKQAQCLWLGCLWHAERDNVNACVVPAFSGRAACVPSGSVQVV
jgi:hypothetical protein